MKQDLVFEFGRKQNKGNSILTETHINHDKIYQIINNWLGPIFLSPKNIHTKGLLGQLHPGLEGVTEVETDSKGRFTSRLLSLITKFSVCPPSGHSTREQLIKGHFFEGLQNQNKILLGDLLWI